MSFRLPPEAASPPRVDPATAQAAYETAHPAPVDSE